MKESCLGMLASVCVAFALLIPTASATQQGPFQAQPWKKTCDFGIVGAEGCVVTVEMRLDPGTNLCGELAQYCVLIKVVCPINNPPGDPGDTCSDEFCGRCANTNRAVSVTCDGKTFAVTPKNMQTWGSTASDCGNAEATIS